MYRKKVVGSETMTSNIVPSGDLLTMPATGYTVYRKLVKYQTRRKILTWKWAMILFPRKLTILSKPSYQLSSIYVQEKPIVDTLRLVWIGGDCSENFLNRSSHE